MQGLFTDRFLKRFFRDRMQKHEAKPSGGIVDMPENEVEPSGGSICSSNQERTVREEETPAESVTHVAGKTDPGNAVDQQANSASAHTTS